MAGDRVDPVQRALEKRLEALEADLAKRSRELTAEEAEELERLHRLIALRRGDRPPRAWSDRLPALLAVALSLAILTFLFFDRRDEVEVELFATVVEAEFVSARSQTLFAPILLDSLWVPFADEIALPRSKGVRARTVIGEPLAITVPRGPSPEIEGRPGAINLEPVSLERGTRVRLDPTTDGAVEILLGGRASELHSALSGVLEVAGPSLGDETRDFGRGRRLRIGGESLSIRIDPFGSAPGPSQTFGEQLSISALNLSRVYRLEGEEETVARRVSTLVEGRLIFEELAGTEIELRPGDRLLLDVVDGWLRQISVEEGSVALVFNGTLRDLSLGFSERKRSLMPTQFEWIRAQHSWMLLWGSALSLMGVVLSVMRWLGFDP